MQFVIGIDEVGRGPLAGPIAVGVVAMPKELNEWHHWEGLKDSKQLSEKKREEWYVRIQEDTRIKWQVSSSGARTIDARGIVAAAREAATRAIGKLDLVPEDAEVLLDHGLSVPPVWKQEQFVKGDEHIPAIALASICAKVTRDRYMVELSGAHPAYGFAQHKGYGTRAHIEALRLHGPQEGIHRALFIRNILGRPA